MGIKYIYNEQLLWFRNIKGWKKNEVGIYSLIILFISYTFNQARKNVRKLCIRGGGTIPSLL